MKLISSVVCATAICTGLFSSGGPCGVAWAQTQGVAPAQTPAENINAKPLPALRFDKTPLTEAAAAMSKVGVMVVADNMAGSLPVTLQAPAGTRLDAALSSLLDVLPDGVTLRLVAVPTGDKAPDGDAVRRLLAAQDALRPLKDRLSSSPGVADAGSPPSANTTPVTKATVPTEISVAGRLLPLDKAAPTLATLGLRPVYLLSNPRSGAAIARATELENERLQLWMEMTTDQRKQAMDSALSNLLNMDSSTRQALFGQMQQQGMAMFQKIQSLPPDQRSQFWRDITGGRFDGNLPPGAAFPGGGTGQTKP